MIFAIKEIMDVIWIQMQGTIEKKTTVKEKLNCI